MPGRNAWLPPSPLTLMRYQTYLIFGPPGSGKGTQGKILGTIPRFFHMACGDVFRSIDTRTPLGQSFIRYSSQGKLVPDELTIELWHRTIDAMTETGRFKPDIDSLVLDGIPRNVNQAVILKETLDIKGIFHLVCPDRERLYERLRKRALKDNRLDDLSEEVIARRLQTYEEESRPVIDFYPPSLVKKIDALQPPVKVLYDILGAILGSGMAPPADPSI